MNLLHILNKIKPEPNMATINRIYKTLDDLESTNKSINVIEMKYNSEMRFFAECIAAAQRVCRHEVIEYYGDPSGGSDSHTTCLIYGANQ